MPETQHIKIGGFWVVGHGKEWRVWFDGKAAPVVFASLENAAIAACAGDQLTWKLEKDD